MRRGAGRFSHAMGVSVFLRLARHSRSSGAALTDSNFTPRRDVSTLTCLATLMGHQSAVTCLAKTSDGEKIITLVEHPLRVRPLSAHDRLEVSTLHTVSAVSRRADADRRRRRGRASVEAHQASGTRPASGSAAGAGASAAAAAGEAPREGGQGRRSPAAAPGAAGPGSRAASNCCSGGRRGGRGETRVAGWAAAASAGDGVGEGGAQGCAARLQLLR